MSRSESAALAAGIRSVETLRLAACVVSLAAACGFFVVTSSASEDLESQFEALERLVTGRPGDAGVRVQYAQALANAGLHSKAVEAYQSALAIDPSLVDVHLLLGLSLLKLQHYEDAIAAFDLAIASQTHGAEALLLKATTLVTLGRVADAKLVLRRASEHASVRAPALLEIGRLSLLDDELDEAEDALARAAKAAHQQEGPGTNSRLATEIRFQKGLLEARRGETNAAIATLEEVVRRQPDNREAHYHLASWYRRLGQPERAIPHEERFLALRESPAASGEKALREGRIEEASKLLRQAVEVEPDNATAHYNLGVALERLGQPSEAMQSYRLALVSEPGYEDASFNLARLELERGKIDEALARFQAISRMNPASPDAFYFLGRTYEEKGDLDAAKNALEKAVLLDPSDAETAFALGANALKRLAPGEAGAWFEKAATLAPDNPRIHHNLGALLQQSGDLTGAADALNRAVRLDPNLVQSWMLLGQCYEALGHRAQARDAYRRVLQLDSRQELARARLNALSGLAP